MPREYVGEARTPPGGRTDELQVSYVLRIDKSNANNPVCHSSNSLPFRKRLQTKETAASDKAAVEVGEADNCCSWMCALLFSPKSARVTVSNVPLDKL